MIVRDATPGDYPSIESIYRGMGMDYALPDLHSPLFLVKKVASDEDNNLLGASFLRLQAECYLWLPYNLSPRMKVNVMREMQPEVLGEAWSKGLDCVEARIPRDIESRFHKRLQELGWSRDREDWHPWSIYLNAFSTSTS